MNLHNLKHADDTASFTQAVLRGIGRDSGLYFPDQLPQFDAQAIDTWLERGFVARSCSLLDRLIGDEFDDGVIPALVDDAFNFPVPVAPVGKLPVAGSDAAHGHVHALELFRGPTLAFKDFGARFLARIMAHLIQRGDHKGPLTILSATSGDTGAAVAHAFHGLPNIQVVILYPQGRISPLQEKMFCTLGGNIHTLAVDADFDTCQSLVKQAFEDAAFVSQHGLNSANSINIARLLAQTCYYFEGIARLRAQGRDNIVISVPSGNFGNLTAGLFARHMGLPVRAFVAGTNANDTVPRYLQDGRWDVRKTVATLSNAMDVSAPSNWPRIEALFAQTGQSLQMLRGAAISEQDTLDALHELHALGYLCEPHGAVAYAALKRHLHSDENGLFLCTAHPAKFREAVEQALSISIKLPPELQRVADLPLRSQAIGPDLAAVKAAVAAAWR